MDIDMTQYEKDLLLRDLCARLPYGVKVLYKGEKYKISSVSICNETITIYGERGYPIEVEIKKVKPYLFPLSNMTEKQFKEYMTIPSGYQTIDWFNKNHVDYRCLIESELVIDATGLNIY
jgi:hypothetical protein